MQSGKIKYSVLVDNILNLFLDTFGADIVFIEKQEKFEHMGYFKIQYKYLPSEYDVIFENDRNVFCIDIYDSEGAKNSLYRIERFENELKIENIEIAIRKLKDVLTKNNFNLYITREGKLFRKKDCQYKRVKNLTELIGR